MPPGVREYRRYGGPRTAAGRPAVPPPPPTRVVPKARARHEVPRIALLRIPCGRALCDGWHHSRPCCHSCYYCRTGRVGHAVVGARTVFGLCRSGPNSDAAMDGGTHALFTHCLRCKRSDASAPMLMNPCMVLLCNACVLDTIRKGRPPPYTAPCVVCNEMT